MWVRQLGQNQSICLNLTQQNGDKDFSAKHDKSVIEGKEKWNVCSQRFYFLNQDCIEGWTKNSTIKWWRLTPALARSSPPRWNISITERILENQMARFKLLENVRRGAARQERECQTLPTLALDRGAVGVLLASLKWFQFWQIDN